METINGKIKIDANRKLVYKVDSYCLGRTIQYLYYYYLENDVSVCCIDTNYKKKNKIIKIMNYLLEKDVNKRLTITELYNLNIV